MTEQDEIKEGNKLIKQFDSTRGLYPQFRWEEPLKYHTSWDWLMPVVEKIERLDDIVFKVEIFLNYCEIELQKGRINYSESSSKIKSTWQAVIAFIKWYNTNPK